MHVRFAAPDWKSLDVLHSEAILAPFFSDERPLTGALGLIDWRLCGFVSRLIQRGVVQGSFGETVLVPLRPRFASDKLFLFGLGPRESFAAAQQQSVTERMLDVGVNARVRAMALVLPGRNTQHVSAPEAIESFVRASANRKSRAEPDEIVLIETPEAQKEMSPILQRERRRARAAEY
ncbi:MAG: M17 family peptidase N-terminal domain-containing protein [Polyangiales bacterium]